MEKEATSAPGFNAQPPTFPSESAPPYSTSPVQPVPTSVYQANYHQPYHHGYSEQEAMVQPQIATQQPGAPVIIRAPVYGTESSVSHCPTCNETVNTKVIKNVSNKTHITAAVLCLLGCCLCVPCVYCIDSLKVSTHYCPKCNVYLGSHSSTLPY